MFSSIFLVLIFFLIGVILKRSALLPENTADVLNSFVLYVSLPAIILLTLPEMELGHTLIRPIGIHWMALGLHVLLIFLAFKLFNLSKEILGVLLIVTTMGNTAFIGIPFIGIFLGESAVPYAIVYDQLGSGIVFLLFMAFVLPAFANSNRMSFKDILIGLITFPAFVAFLLGLFLTQAPPAPEFIQNILSQLSATLIPCAIIAVGFQMKFKISTQELKGLFIGLALKLLVLPLVLLAILSPFMEGIAFKASILQAGMSPMITAGMLATNAKLRTDLSVALVGYGILLSFGTLLIVFELL